MKPTFQGEVQFRRYSDTSTQGQQIVLALADREALSAFIGKEGKRFMAVLVEIGDDEQPVQPAPAKARPKDTRGPLCREACDYCAMPDFHEWVAVHGYTKDELGAKVCILNTCNVGSRKEFDSDPLAGDVFIERIRVPFMKWQREQRK